MDTNRRCSPYPGWLAWVSVLLIAQANAANDDHAVVLMYHHISEETPPATSVSPRDFETHLEYLAAHNYTVLPLDKIADAIRNAQPLPERSVAITFDDAYTSVLTEALPRLVARKWPFTVFVATNAIDNTYAGYLTWDELRRIESSGGTIANHSASHAHLMRRLDGESRASWHQRVTTDIEVGAARLKQELDQPSRLFAWPYGEFDATLEALAHELDLIAFGQQSGPVGYRSSMQSLPRFPLATGFADIDSLADKLQSRPLPATIVAPQQRVLPTPAVPPRLRLRIPDGPYRREAMRCFVAGQAPPLVEWRNNEVTISARAVAPPGRGKFNCTAPSTEESDIYFWFSYLWMQPHDDGSWYEE